MTPFLKAYLKYYALGILAFAIHFAYVWYINHYWNGGDGEAVNYRGMLIALALLAVPFAFVDGHHEK